MDRTARSSPPSYESVFFCVVLSWARRPAPIVDRSCNRPSRSLSQRSLDSTRLIALARYLGPRGLATNGRCSIEHCRGCPRESHQSMRNGLLDTQVVWSIWYQSCQTFGLFSSASGRLSVMPTPSLGYLVGYSNGWVRSVWDLLLQVGKRP